MPSSVPSSAIVDGVTAVHNTLPNKVLNRTFSPTAAGCHYRPFDLLLKPVFRKSFRNLFALQESEHCLLCIGNSSYNVRRRFCWLHFEMNAIFCLHGSNDFSEQ
jgi:hypothetical protein